MIAYPVFLGAVATTAIFLREINLGKSHYTLNG